MFAIRRDVVLSQIDRLLNEIARDRELVAASGGRSRNLYLAHEMDLQNLRSMVEKCTSPKDKRVLLSFTEANIIRIANNDQQYDYTLALRNMGIDI